jgi:integrase
VASVSRNRQTGLYRILFVHPETGKRTPLHLGRHATKRWADEVRGHVEHLVSAALQHKAPPDDTSKWVAALSDAKLRNRLAAIGLIVAPEKVARQTLKGFLDAYMASRPDLKEGTRIALQQAIGYLTEFFGADKPLHEIRPGDADAWRAFLASKKKLLGKKKIASTENLAEATIRRRCGAAKQFFKAAVRMGHLASNPFADLKAGNLANPARQHYISRDVATKVLEKCPDAEWKLIFALARYAGLRCPSEILLLTWGDINWADGRMTVHSPKTERHPGQDSRQVPLFPELLPYLQEAFEAADEGAEFVITRYRRTNSNLQTQLRRILWNAGIDPWPRLFQNLRASCDTDLAAHFPAHVCARWLGHTPAIAAKHYLQVTEKDYLEAAGIAPNEGRALLFGPNEKAARKAAQSPSVRPCQTETPEDGQEATNAETPANVGASQNVSEGGEDISRSMVGDTGLEPVTSCVSSRRSSQLS